MRKNRVKWLAMVVSCLMIFVISAQSTFGYIVTSTQSLINTFKPLESFVNGLLITKTVEHPFGAMYDIPERIEFDFELDFGPEYANYVFNTTEGDKKADSDGKFSVSVRPEDSFGVENIDEGTEVKVTELQNKAGFSVKDGEGTQSVVISSEAAASVNFVNIYTPGSVNLSNVTLTGEKVLEGREWREGDSFSFLLEYEAENGEWISVGTETVTYDSENENFNRFDFSEKLNSLEFENIGTYVFRLSEEVGTDDEMSYDKTIKYFSVTVGDADMDGKLEIQDVAALRNSDVTETDGVYNVTVVFNNTFVPEEFPDDLSVNIFVDKNISNIGTQSIGPENFEFTLVSSDMGAELSEKSDENGNAAFELTFTPDDIGKTYVYTLTETNDGRENIIYDDTSYQISVTILLDEANNILTAETRVNGEIVEDALVSFENTYDYTPPVSPPTNDGGIGRFFWPIMTVLSLTALVVLISQKKRFDI